VLELGVGSGRLAVPLAEHDIEVWGIDASEAMVEQLRAKPGGDRVRVTIGDMADLDLRAIDGGDTATFGVVFVAVNTFFLLTDEEAQRRCLQRVASVLDQDGMFLLEAFVPIVDPPTNVVEARTVETDHVILTATRHDPDSQMAWGQMIEIRESGIRLRPVTVRYARPEQLDAMAAAAGLTLRERWSDWSGTPFTDSDTGHVSIYVHR
jgi:SAM-dependent methyltransferase